GPAFDLLAFQKCAVDPGEGARGGEGFLAFRQECAAREGWHDAIKNALETGLRRMPDPMGEIAHVDELNRVVRRSPHQHLAAASEPRRPIGKPSCRRL